MKATSLLKAPPPKAGPGGLAIAQAPLEYVEIESGLTPKGSVVRRATGADKSRFKAEYAAFKASSVKPEPVAVAEVPAEAPEEAPVEARKESLITRVLKHKK